MKRVDIVVIGGGPGGSTVSTLLKRYSPSLNVALLEQTIFPRHHVGESLLSGSTPVLIELGVYDKINAAGFPEKLGATYVWGQNSDTWGFEFEEINGQLQHQGISLPKEYFKGWQVTRAVYDKLLLDHAEECGVEVIQGARVESVRIEEDSCRGVTYQRNGEMLDIQAEIVVDASGQNAIIGRRLGIRQFDKQLRNIAVYGYWKGARWKFAYAGFKNLTRILIASTPRGWLWYIPMSPDIISVGFVFPAFQSKQMNDLESSYKEELFESPEVRDLLEGSTLTRISADQKTNILIERDWSYTSERMVGKGWLSVGDAAGFVDPILSSGVMLAHQNGQKAAYTINSVLREADPILQQRYWNFYESTYKETLKAYREMACFWYGNNYSRESWWWQAWRDMMQANQQNTLNHRDSFMRLASGYANRTESTSLFGSYTAKEALVLADHLFRNSDFEGKSYDQNTQIKLSPNAMITDGMYFHGGIIHRTDRIVSRSSNRYLDLYPGEEERIEVLKNTISVSEFEAGKYQTNKLGRIHRTPKQLLDQLDLLDLICRP